MPHVRVSGAADAPRGRIRRGNLPFKKYRDAALFQTEPRSRRQEQHPSAERGVVFSDVEADKIERFAPLVACAHVGSLELIPNTAREGDVITVIARINMGAVNFAWGWRRLARPDFEEVSSRDDENDDRDERARSNRSYILGARA